MEVDEFLQPIHLSPRGGGAAPAGGGEKCVASFFLWKASSLEKKAPGDYSWRGEDKNVSPPEP